MTSSRDVEADLRARLGRDARSWVAALRQGQTTVDAALDRLVDRSFRDPSRLRDAAELLGGDHREAQALLRRAVRRAADPPAAAAPGPFAPPDAPRPGARVTGRP